MAYEELDWEVELTEEDDSSSFRLLDEGYYPFEVVSAKKSFTNGNPPYKCVDLTLRVGVAPETATVTDRIAMHSGMKWKIAQFGVSIGARRHGERTAFNPSETTGMRGWCEIEHREFTYTRGDKAGETGYSNNIARYIDPADAPADGKPYIKGKAEQAPTQQASQQWAGL